MQTFHIKNMGAIIHMAQNMFLLLSVGYVTEKQHSVKTSMQGTHTGILKYYWLNKII
jgi:hypothetical protein